MRFSQFFQYNYWNFFADVPGDLKTLLTNYNSIFEPGLGKFTIGNIYNNFKTKNFPENFLKLDHFRLPKIEMELGRLQNFCVIEPVDYKLWGTTFVPALFGSVRNCVDFEISINPFLEMSFLFNYKVKLFSLTLLL